MISIINVNNNNINEIIKNLKERSNTINIRKSVEEIIENIKLHGNKALREYTLKFDNVELKDFLISNEEIEIILLNIMKNKKRRDIFIKRN